MRIAFAVIVMIVMGVVAKKKGFNPLYWIIAAGLPGLIVLLCMPSARAASLDEAKQIERRARGNLVGIILSCVGLALVAALVGMIRSSTLSPWPLVRELWFAATIIMLIAVFRLFPGVRSFWRVILRWSWVLLFALNVLFLLARWGVFSYGPDSARLLNAISNSLTLAAAIALLVLATRSLTEKALSNRAHRAAEDTAPGAEIAA